MTTLMADLRRVSATSEDVGDALAHVTPFTTDDVVAVLDVCRSHGVAFTVRGGGTRAADATGTVLLSTLRLDRLGPVDDGTLTAGAGALLGDVLRRVQRHRWNLEVDPVTQEAATLGGAAACGWGAVLGLEAVLADGSVLRHLAGPGEVPAAGVITAVRVRLEQA